MSLPKVGRIFSTSPSSSSVPSSPSLLKCPSLKRRNSAPSNLGSIFRAIGKVPSFSRRNLSVSKAASSYSNNGVEACYKVLVDLFDCDDQDMYSNARQQPPLSQYVMHVIRSTNAPKSVIVDTIVFVQRYHSACADGGNGPKSGGHIIFTCAFMWAASLHLPRGVRSLSNEFWAGTTGYSTRIISLLQANFLEKLNWDLGPMKRKEKRLIKFLGLPTSSDDTEHNVSWPSCPLVQHRPRISDEDSRWSTVFIDGPYKEKIQARVEASPRPIFIRSP